MCDDDDLQPTLRVGTLEPPSTPPEADDVRRLSELGDCSSEEAL